MFKIRKIKVNLKTKDTGSFVSKSKHIIKLTGFFGAISYPGCVIVIEGEALIQLPSNTLINFSLKEDLSDDFYLYLVMCDMDYDNYAFNKMKPYIDSLIHVQNGIFEHTNFLQELINRDAFRTLKKLDIKRTDSISERIHRLISKQIQHRWTAEEISKNLNMSKATLMRRISQEKTTLSDLILSARMNKAAYLLLKKKHPIKKVAHLTGFSSASYFCKKFKETYGNSPKQFVNLMDYKQKETQRECAR
ncbi:MULTISPECIES: helix-turn-helix transcriptional regulator [Vibrio harveyi group]|uniref:helix-turn-helix transcriptional regulator n=1 Tax=Vibrio harveyi group TaxID=717610 RepID=UPI0004282E3D|nr:MULTISPECIES: helix-turn-helix transcriptional regulator [Vibrio harveyi group]